MDGSVKDVNVTQGTEDASQLIFDATGLSESQHHFVLRNAGGNDGVSWAGIDFINITSGDGDPR